MKRHVQILLVATIAVCVTLGTLAIGKPHTKRPHAQSEHDGPGSAPPSKHFREHADTTATQRHDADRVLAEMHEHADRRLGTFHTRSNTFGSTDAWSHDWILHWIEVEYDGHTIWIYHATHKNHLSRRFTVLWNDHHARPAKWERVP